MATNKRYGILSVMNAIFLDVTTKKPLLVFDSLKTSSIENTSQKQEIRGGQGNKKLLSFEYGREATLKMQDALISDQSLALLSGQAVSTTATTLIGREILTVTTGTKVTLAKTPLASTISVFKMSNGLMQDEITGFTVSTNDVVMTATTPTTAIGDSVCVVYSYTSSANVAKVTFNASTFPQNFAVVGDCILSGDDGVPYKAQFYIAKAKLQSDFTITLEAENPSTFDFNLDILADASTGDLYTITRY